MDDFHSDSFAIFLAFADNTPMRVATGHLASRRWHLPLVGVNSMPYRISWEPSGVYRTYFGVLTDSERRRSLEEIFADWRFGKLRYAITDYLSVETFVESSLATREFAAQHIGPLMTNPNIVLAAVASNPIHIDHIRNLKRSGLMNVPYEVFPDVALARQWIAEKAGVPLSAQGTQT